MSSFDPAPNSRPKFQVMAFREALSFEPERVMAHEGPAQIEEAAARVESADPLAPPAPSQKFDRLLHVVESAAAALEDTQRDFLDAQRESIVALALAIADRVVAAELAEAPALRQRTIERWLDQALAELGNAGEPVRIAVCPDDFDALSQESSPLGGAIWRADPGLAPGEARVESGATRMALSIKTAMAAIEKRMAAVAANEEAAS